MSAIQTFLNAFKILGPHMASGDTLNKTIGQGSLNAQDTITALAGGGATGAAPLYLGMNRASVVATTADSVMLPPSNATNIVIFQNSGAQSCQVFANTTSSLAAGTLDTINGTAGATGVAVAAGKMAIFCCFTTGAWVGPVALA
jgi:hypothetical protein